MSQITWKNIDAPDAGGASYAGQAASTAFERGFDRLDKMFESIQENRENEWDTQADKNTLDVLAQIEGTQDLSDLDQLKQALSPEALRGQYGDQLDFERVRSALNNQDNVIRTDTQEQQQFEDTQTNRQYRDEIAGITNLINSDKVKEAATAISDSTMPDRLKTQLTKALGMQQDEITQENREKTRFDNMQTLFNEAQLNKNQEQAISDQVNGILDNTPATLAQARDMLTHTQEYQVLDATEQVAALNTLNGLYKGRYGLTDEQEAKHQLQVTELNTEHDPLIAQKEMLLQQFLDNHPVDMYGGNTEIQTIIETGSSVQDIIKAKSPDDNFDWFWMDRWGDQDGSDAVDLLHNEVTEKLKQRKADGLMANIEPEFVMKMVAAMVNPDSSGDIDDDAIDTTLDRVLGLLERRQHNVAIRAEKQHLYENAVLQARKDKTQAIYDNKQMFIDSNKLRNKR